VTLDDRQASSEAAAEADSLENLRARIDALDSQIAHLLQERATVSLRVGQTKGGGDTAPPEPKNAKGSVKFWLKDGQLAKYEYKVSGTITFNGEDRDIERTTSVEIKDVGKTKVEVPEGAKKKLT